MLSMQELMDMRMQQQLAHEIYRQQIMQRIPGAFLHIKSMGVDRMPSANGFVIFKLKNMRKYMQPKRAYLKVF